MKPDSPVFVFLLVAFAGLWCAAAGARECPADGLCEQAREVVEDLQRIVTPDGVQESFSEKIGGIRQWIYARGKDRDNPVVLFIHGGPASPAMPGAWQFQRPIEEYFTVVHYDQRAAGRTYLETDPETIADTITIDRYVEDAIEIAELVARRYEKKKLVLMAHSWGTIIAVKAALKRPDLFHAYVGIGQVINTRKNEKLSFEYGLEQAKRNRNELAVAELESIAPYPGEEPVTRDRIVIARKWAQFYGGLTAYRDGSARYYHGASRLSPEYDSKAAQAIDEGNRFTLSRVLDEFLGVDFDDVDQFPIPVVMFMGRHDYTTPSAPTAAWLSRVEAPCKQGVWFENSAHMIPWEEPGKLLISLLEYVRPLVSDGDGADD